MYASKLRLRFLLTHPVWDVTSISSPASPAPNISTHTSRVGCDVVFRCGGRTRKFLLTHPVWDVTPIIISTNIVCIFLLTHPVWDVTETRARKRSNIYNFYSHIPCGMWPRVTAGFQSPCTISTHTSRVGCDMAVSLFHRFQTISTHTSRVGCDAVVQRKWYVSYHFYSHIPCGMWQHIL